MKVVITCVPSGQLSAMGGATLVPPPSLSDGGGGPPKAVEGARPRTALGIAPSTMLRMVLLARFAGEERCAGAVE